MHKIDFAAVKEGAAAWPRYSIRSLQVAVYVMCGGGALGRFAAEQPADFYIDVRVGKLPYSRREIRQAVSVLRILAEAKGLNTHSMPDMPRFRAAGIL